MTLRFLFGPKWLTAAAGTGVLVTFVPFFFSPDKLDFTWAPARLAIDLLPRQPRGDVPLLTGTEMVVGISANVVAWAVLAYIVLLFVVVVRENRHAI